jgi:hypothetical protein
MFWDRWALNITLLITGVFTTSAGASPNYIALSSFEAVWSISVGGNLPVGSAVFLGISHPFSPSPTYPLTEYSPEIVPVSHPYLLSIWWWLVGHQSTLSKSYYLALNRELLLLNLAANGPVIPCPNLSMTDGGISSM